MSPELRSRSDLDQSANAEQRPVEASARPEPVAPASDFDADRVRPYVPRALQQHLVDDPTGQSWTAEGTAAFVDISGFTKLSEQLARKGREGAEQITDAIGGSFAAILSVANQKDGQLLKFGGDAMLLWFHGESHAARACQATFEMRKVLDDVGRIDLPDAQVTLRMSQGVHSGHFNFFAVGTSHFEFLAVGPAWSRLVAMEHEAGAGEIVVSTETAALLPTACVGDAKGPGMLLRQDPPGGMGTYTPADPSPVPSETLARCLPRAIREHVLGGGGAPEHRPVTIAFIRFQGTDALIDQHGPAAAAEALHRLMSAVEAAAEEQDVAFLASDVDADGGKLILTSGAPKATGNDEERMLLAVRKIISGDLPIPIRIGVHRGAVFAGDIGPRHRRTYTVMGDAVNLTARLMAKAEPGRIYATADVLERSNTVFEMIKLEPFAVKGKAEPVQAWSVERAQGSRTRQVSQQRLPLTGRNAELGVMRKAFASARSGAGRLVEVVGESGIGKTRLLEALRDAAAGFRKVQAACEAYTSSIPYVVWRELLRELLELGRDDPDAAIGERVQQEVATKAPDLAPWLPLLAAVFGIEMPPTPEVEMLAEKNRGKKLHESVVRFLEAMVPDRLLIEFENVDHMDAASAELLSYVIGELSTRPWLLAVARRPSGSAFVAPESPAVARIELKPLALPDVLRLAQLATAKDPLPAHVLDVVAKRSGGNPQFLRDLLRTAVESGGAADLPDSAEAAAMAQIDALPPEDRALVRRAAVFGLTFHPRMLSWLAEDGEGATVETATWARLQDVFDGEPDGYLRFRHSLLRDAAYQGLPFKLRRQYHGAIAARLEAEMDDPEEAGGTLSLHYAEAGDYRAAWRFAKAAAKRAEGVYAYVEAAGLYARALAAGRKLEDLGSRELATVHQELGDAWYRASEFRKAVDAYAEARNLVGSDRLSEGKVLLKLSRVEEKLGQYPEALRWVDRAREVVLGLDDPDAARHIAESSSWYATVLQLQGRTGDALQWAERASHEAEAADDAEALGAAYFVIGWAYSRLGKPGGEAMLLKSLELFRRSGNRIRQANILGNVGVICQSEGRWDDAMSHYERSRDESTKLGNVVNAALSRMNIAEILTDRGELAEAESMIQQALPVWKSSQYRYFLGACLGLLGRVSTRSGRFDDALARFDEARTLLQHVGAEDEVADVDARIAECRLLKGEHDAALALADSILARAEAPDAIARLAPLVQRVRGYVMLLQGDPWGAREAFDASLDAARSGNNLFEVALTLTSLADLDRFEGVEPPQEMIDESRAIVAKLKVRALPPQPALA